MIVKNNMLAFCVCYLSICAELLSQMLATGGDLGRVSRQRLSRFTAKPAEGPPASCESAQMLWRSWLVWQLCCATHMVASCHPTCRCNLGRRVCPRRCRATQPWMMAQDIGDVGVDLLAAFICHHRNYYCTRMGSDVSRVNVPLIVEGEVSL